MCFVWGEGVVEHCELVVIGYSVGVQRPDIFLDCVLSRDKGLLRGDKMFEEKGLLNIVSLC